MNHSLIASVMIPAITSPTQWVRTAKTFYITDVTPVWQVRMLDEFVRGTK